MPSLARIPNLQLCADTGRSDRVGDTDEKATRAISDCFADNYGKSAYEAQLLAELVLDRLADVGLQINTNLASICPTLLAATQVKW